MGRTGEAVVGDDRKSIVEWQRWVKSGSADHVDGLPRTRPVYLSKRTPAGPAGWGQPWANYGHRLFQRGPYERDVPGEPVELGNDKLRAASAARHKCFRKLRSRLPGIHISDVFRVTAYARPYVASRNLTLT